MHGVPTECREARFLLKGVALSRRGEEGGSVLILGRTDRSYRSISQSYLAAAGGSVWLTKLGSLCGTGFNLLLDRWVELDSSHCWRAGYVFSLCRDASFDLLLDWEAGFGSATLDAMLDLLPVLYAGLLSVLCNATLNLLLGW